MGPGDSVTDRVGPMTDLPVWDIENRDGLLLHDLSPADLGVPSPTTPLPCLNPQSRRKLGSGGLHPRDTRSQRSSPLSCKRWSLVTPLLIPLKKPLLSTLNNTQREQKIQKVCNKVG